MCPPCSATLPISINVVYYSAASADSWVLCSTSAIVLMPHSFAWFFFIFNALQHRLGEILSAEDAFPGAVERNWNDKPMGAIRSWKTGKVFRWGKDRLECLSSSSWHKQKQTRSKAGRKDMKHDKCDECFEFNGLFFQKANNLPKFN